jgi:hypothetical protein
VIITYEGRRYPFSLDDVTVKQALAVEKFMGCSFAEWGKRLQGDDVAARQVLGWLILHPAGDVPIGDTDFKMVALARALDEAYAAEAEAAAAVEPDPTSGAVVLNGRDPIPVSYPAS